MLGRSPKGDRRTPNQNTYLHHKSAVILQLPLPQNFILAATYGCNQNHMDAELDSVEHLLFAFSSHAPFTIKGKQDFEILQLVFLVQLQKC